MADRQIVKEWLNRAEEDFDFAAANLKEENEFYAQICFHFHQSAEKYLKAFIVAYDLEFGKLHNLMNLAKICARKEPSILKIIDECGFLNAAYIDSRYPVQWPTDYTKEKALKAKEAAYAIAEIIKELLKKGGYAD